MKDKKMVIVTLVLGIVLIIGLLTASSYALFYNEKTLDNEDSFTTGILDIELVEEEGYNTSISLTNSLPMSDDEGKQTTPFKLKLRNNGNLSYTFDLKLVNNTTENSVDTNYLKIMVDSDNPVSYSSLTDAIIKNDITLNPREEIIIDVRLWLDITTPNTQIGKEFNGILIVNGLANENNLTFVVNDSTPGVLAGDGTVDSPYLIESIEDLVAFSNSVNQGNDYSGSYVRLENNLDFNNNISYANYNDITMFPDYNNDGNNDNILIELTSTDGQGFIPIGVGDTSFNGIFDGNGKTISNLYINYNSSNASYSATRLGLFGTLSGAQLSNLSISGEIVSNVNGSYLYAGAFVGQSINSEIVNCANNVSMNVRVIGDYNVYVSGIIGYSNASTEVIDSSNYGDIIGESSEGIAFAGGIVAYNYGLISNCKNYSSGSIKSITYNSEAPAGGIASYNRDATVTDCVNYAEISSVSNNAMSRTGGIAGLNWKNSGTAVIQNCVNYGKITSNNSSDNGAYHGGITGDNYGEISGSFNYGEIGGIDNGYSYIGGISGRNYNNAIITTSINHGIVIGKSLAYAPYTGGIAGYNTISSTISSCVNYADIEANAIGSEAPVGGIVGYNRDSTIESCYNKGSINGISTGSYVRVGGISGNNWASSGTSTIKNSYNVGDVSGSGTTGTYLGGITGRNTGTITYTYYLDTISNAVYGNGNSTNISNSGSKTMSEMKNSSFVSLLNTGLAETIWNSDGSVINEGYPILSFQK